MEGSRTGERQGRPAAGDGKRETKSEPRGHERRAILDGSNRNEPVVIGLLAAPGVVLELAQTVARDLPRQLRRRFSEVEWRVALRPEPTAAASRSDVDLVEIAYQRMLAEGWSLAVCLTDFPVHVGNRPVTAYASASRGVGLVSVPALGPMNLDVRVRAAVVKVIEGLLGERVDKPEQAGDRRRHDRMRRRALDLSSTMGRAEVREDRSIFFVAAVGLGNLRLLLGMVRANRPWRLIVGLSRSLVAALGLDIFGVASPGVWIVADAMGWVRLLIASVASVLVTCVTLIWAHHLWERARSERPEARERVVLFNLATALTVAIGVVTLYVCLFLIDLIAAAGMITSGAIQKELGHPGHAATYIALTALATTLATLGGALGAALENDRAVREAAYGYHPDVRTEAMGEPSAVGGAA